MRPELLAGSFKCRKCMSRVPLVEQQYGYTEPMRCLNPQCKSKGVREGDTVLSEDDASGLAGVWLLTGGGRGSVWRAELVAGHARVEVRRLAARPCAGQGGDAPRILP